MTIDEMIEVLQGIKDGKQIQCRDSEGKWHNTSNRTPNFVEWHYRIKPEPREIWVNDYGKFIGGASFDKQDTKCLAGTGCLGQVLFREVLP